MSETRSEFGEPWELKLHEDPPGPEYRNHWGNVDNAAGEQISYGEPYEENGFSVDYLKRIVACVNFCRGVPTEALLRRAEGPPQRILGCHGPLLAFPIEAASAESVVLEK